MSGQGSHTPLHTGIPSEQCVGGDFHIVRALEGAPAHTCGDPVHTWAACTSLSSVRVIADQNCVTSTGLYVAVRKENLL